MDYRSELTRQYKTTDDRDSRWNAVEELVGVLAAHEKRARKPSFDSFLREIALVGKEDELDRNPERRGAVTLMTLHSAKGLEFPQVFLVGMEEGLLPHERSLKEGERQVEEERRLAYVGITRAQNRLTLSLAAARTKWGKPRPSTPSRFLFEMYESESHPVVVKLRELAEHAARPRGGHAKGARRPRTKARKPVSVPRSTRTAPA